MNIKGSLVPNEAVTSCYQGTTISGIGVISQTTCSGPYSYCSKSTYTSGGSPYIVKICSNACVEGTYSSITYYCCSTDNCNLSATLASNRFLIALSIVIANGLALIRSN